MRYFDYLGRPTVPMTHYEQRWADYALWGMAPLPGTRHRQDADVIERLHNAHRPKTFTDRNGAIREVRGISWLCQ